MPHVDNIIGAFSDDHVIKLTGLSKSQLRYWDETCFFPPSYASENRRNPYSRVYSFRDVVGLRTLAILRKDYGIPLQHLRKVAAKLSRIKKDPWSEITLYVLGKEVQFREPDTRRVRSAVSGQYVNLPLRDVIHNVEDEAKKLRSRADDQLGKVEKHRYVAHNAWVLAGTRIPTKAIRRFNEAGYTVAQIIEEYPSLTRRDIKAALAHEGKLAKIA